MTILIIGATGFLGRNLFTQLRESGEDVIGTTRSERSGIGMISVDLEKTNEYLKIISYVELFGISCIVNMAANGVSPLNRTKVDEKATYTFFENLTMVLTTYPELKLLQIGTVSDAQRSDFYFVQKSQIRELLLSANVKDQVAILDLPKVVGAGEPLGRFTSDLTYSLVMSREHVILHPCHKRNFISVFDVVLLILATLENLDNSSHEYPMYRTKRFSNYEVAKSLMGSSFSGGRGVKFDHFPAREECRKCPADENELLISPSFSDMKKMGYLMMNQTQTVETALKEQFENAVLLRDT